MERKAKKGLMGIFDSPKMDSRIVKEQVTKKEKWLGYFFGPAGVIILNAVMASYLNVFYTDVIQAGTIWNGMFLLVLPIASKIIDAITNLIMGQLIEKTRTRQGKARPWILLSAPIVALGGILAFAVPKAAPSLQAVWIIFSYNLYYCIGYTIYYMSHSMMVPLSTRDSKSRDSLAVFSNMSQNLIPGMFVAMIFPAVIIPALGVDQSKWLAMVSFFSVLVLPFAVMEYFYTKERISEEGKESAAWEKHSLKEQIKACVSSKYWRMVIFMLIYQQIVGNLQNTSLIYYSNWVLGTYNDGVTQAVLSVGGNFPLGLGIPILFPLVNRFGKRRIIIAGSLIAAVMGFVFLLHPDNMTFVLVALIIRAFGALPVGYLMMALLADAMDHIEWKSGFRADGFSMSIYTVIFTVAAGVAQGLFNLGLSVLGYIPPAADGSWVPQNEAIQTFFVWGYQGVCAVSMLITVVVMLAFKLEKELPEIQREIQDRKRRAE